MAFGSFHLAKIVILDPAEDLVATSDESNTDLSATEITEYEFHEQWITHNRQNLLRLSLEGRFIISIKKLALVLERTIIIETGVGHVMHFNNKSCPQPEFPLK